MKVVHNLLSYIGFIMFMLGMTLCESEGLALVIAVTMFIVGGLILLYESNRE